MKYDFLNDLENERFELLFAEYLGKPYELSVGYFPFWDIVKDNVRYEVKRDYYYNTTKNILVEQYFNLEKGLKGWIYHTKADYLVVFISDVDFYIVNMYRLKNIFFNNLADWRCVDILQDLGFHTRNWLCLLEKGGFRPVFGCLNQSY